MDYILRSPVPRSVWFGLSALALFACASEGMPGSENELERDVVEQVDGEQILGNSSAEDTPDGPSTSDGSSLGSARQAITGASKLCRVAIAEGGDWIDTMVVNNSWTLDDCARWAGQVGGNDRHVVLFYSLGCMTSTDFSFTNPQPFGCP
jgi:hypothetical protein